MYKVILVDDERFVLTSLEGRIKWSEWGFEVAAKASSAAEGYELIRRLRPDAVFTDIKMPGMSGLELIRMASQEFPKTKFVVISGYSEFEYAKKAIEYGVLGFCIKPFDEEEIYGILKKIKNQLSDETDSGSFWEAHFDGDVEKRKQILVQNGILPSHPKVIVISPSECLVCFSAECKSLQYQFDKIHNVFIVSGFSGRENIILQPDLINKTGISNVFFDIANIDKAVEEAKIASFQFFISGNAVNFYRESPDSSVIAESVKSIRKHYELREQNEINNIFKRLSAAFASSLLTIKEALRFYNSVLSFLEDHLSDYCEDYEELTGRFPHVAAMLEFLLEIIRSHLFILSENKDKSSVMNDILLYINEHYQDSSLTVQTISDRFGFNANYISQLFKKSAEENFTKYLTSVRIEHAKTLLSRSEYSINSIGERVGYPDYFYFAKVFKKYTGETPGAFRRSNQVL